MCAIQFDTMYRYRQVLLEASLDVALGALRLLQKDVDGAATWFVSALAVSQDNGLDDICQGLCQLLLPQGLL